MIESIPKRFLSTFADNMEAMLEYRKALGFSASKYVYELQNFDRYTADNFPQRNILDREMVTGWLNQHLNKSRKGMIEKAIAIRHLGKYLSAIGKEAYILPDEYVVREPTSFTPYLFSDDELARLFNAADHFKKSETNPLVSKIPPVLFRLIYTCGLRPNEGRKLLRENINLKTGEILLTNTKRKKERVVVMSDDMLALCKRYVGLLDSLKCESNYFFPDKDGNAFGVQKIERMLKKCWCDANPNIAEDKLPNIRVYDLRHRFASAVLCKWLDEKRNLNNKLPYLCAYMGHDKISDTAYYIHILPERLVKSAGVNWNALEEIIPGVIL